VTQTNFSTLALHPNLLSNLDSLGYSEMTPIQAQSLPLILQGKDLLGQAKTGSGKTAAFGLGVLNQIDIKNYDIQAMVLCPTRELADQVCKEIRRLARGIPNVKVLSLCGGVSIGPQIGSLEHGAHIVVGTPGRIEDHLRKRTLKLDGLRMLVLDEADRMLDMGFNEAITNIAKQMPRDRQTLLFSATYPSTIKKLSQSFQRNPESVRIESKQESSDIKQLFFEVNKKQRSEAVIALLAKYQPESSLVFCNTKQKCQDICDDLRQQGVIALALHGDLEQRDRDRVMVRFANRSCSVLVATDVAARGLDVKGLDAVINLELSRDPEVHVHRIGRTGRAGEQGLALSIYTPEQTGLLNAIEDYLGVAPEIISGDELDFDARVKLYPPMVTLVIDGGKKDKLRPGDILGALTGELGIDGSEVGKIDISHFATCIAIKRQSAKLAMQALENGKIKGRKFKIRRA
jgi:ATP-independent RNA helicase DbpA|tara:strand:- start:16963 stop:18342 length:1380 start_codon:yes stop_codon:yes gene_type:complete